jgi:hypothetical protein
MKLERLHEYVVPTLALLGGMGVAYFAGHFSGQGQFGLLLLLLYGLFLLGILLVMRAGVWVFIPMAWHLGGQIPELPLPFAVRDLVILSVFGCFLVLKAVKVVRLKPKTEIMDLMLILVIVYVASVFVRNPVGVNALNSARVGGRPYFTAIVAVLAYWILARVVMTPSTARRFPLLMMSGQMLDGFLSMITYHFPSTVPLLSRLYSTVSSETYAAQDLQTRSVGEGTNRQAYLMNIGLPLVRGLCAWFPPLTLINPLYFFRFLFFGLGVYCTLISGFRSVLLIAIAVFFLSSYFRNGMRDMLRYALILVPLAAVLLILQGRVFQLPLSAQRTLSFLPGHWDPVAVSEAQGSTEWRIRMWKDSLFTDKYIQNKVLGDGFGFSMRELEVMAANSMSGTTEDAQENLLISGGVHSGPVSAIRYVGYVGLFIFMGLLIVVAKAAWVTVRRAKNTPYFSAALYVCTLNIWTPFHFVFIFGGFDSDLPSAIFNVGMIKMLQNSLDAYEAHKAAQNAPAPVERPVLVPVRRPLAPASTMFGATPGPRQPRTEG